MHLGPQRAYRFNPRLTLGEARSSKVGWDLLSTLHPSSGRCPCVEWHTGQPEHANTPVTQFPGSTLLPGLLSSAFSKLRAGFALFGNQSSFPGYSREGSSASYLEFLPFTPP